MKLLKLILRQTCTHRFSWPRIDNTGSHYQVCLGCGIAYEYNWNDMKRTNRILSEKVPGSDLQYLPH